MTTPLSGGLEIESGETLVRQFFTAVDAWDMPGLLRTMTADVHFRFGNAQPTVGHEGVGESIAFLTPAVKSLSHDLLQIWTVDTPAPAVVCQIDVTYQRHDGSEITLPAVDVFRLRDGLVADCRIYIDTTPLFAA